VESDCFESPQIIERWTNSKTIKKTLSKPSIIVIPPHDYSQFRSFANKERAIDCAAILRSNDSSKRVDLFVEAINRLGLKGHLITTAPNEEMKREISKSRTKNLKISFNCNKEKTAKILGRSKVLFHPSEQESCPLTIYEAMNAGAVPVARNIGAIAEQIGDVGLIFSSNDGIDAAILSAIKRSQKPEEQERIMKRGINFDKKYAEKKIKQRLAVISKRLGCH